MDIQVQKRIPATGAAKSDGTTHTGATTEPRWGHLTAPVSIAATTLQAALMRLAPQQPKLQLAPDADPANQRQFATRVGELYGAQNVSYLKYHNGSDGTAKGHYLLAEGRQYFWNENKSILQIFNPGTKTWDQVLPVTEQRAIVLEVESRFGLSGMRYESSYQAPSNANKTGVFMRGQDNQQYFFEPKTSALKKWDPVQKTWQELKACCDPQVLGAAGKLIEPEVSAVLQGVKHITSEELRQLQAKEQVVLAIRGIFERVHELPSGAEPTSNDLKFLRSLHWWNRGTETQRKELVGVILDKFKQEDALNLQLRNSEYGVTRRNQLNESPHLIPVLAYRLHFTDHMIRLACDSNNPHLPKLLNIYCGKPEQEMRKGLAGKGIIIEEARPYLSQVPTMKGAPKASLAI